MIISNQEIAIHLEKIRNLTSYTSGRFVLRVSLEERHPKFTFKATPMSAIQKEEPKPDNKSEIDQQYFLTRAFALKGCANVDINEVYIFKLDSPISSTKEDESSLTLLVQLIQIDNNKNKVVGVYQAAIKNHAAHQYIQMDFYQQAPCQITGSFHRVHYKFQFKSGNIAIDLSTFCQKYYKTKVNEMLQYLQNQSLRNHQQLTEYSHSLFKQQIQNDYVQLQKTIIFKVMESQIDFYQRETEIGSHQDYISNQYKLDAPKKRKKIFSTTKDHRVQRYEAFSKILHQSAQKIYLLWREILQKLLTIQGSFYIYEHALQHRKKLHESIKNSITSCKGSKDYDLYGQDRSLKQKLASRLRNQQTQYTQYDYPSIKNQFPIMNKQFFSINRPIFFQQKSIISQTHQQELAQQVLVILVHGLGACRLDMQKLKIQLKRYYDNKVRVFSSSTNQGRTEGDIESMGLRLASEIDYQLIKYTTIPKICMIGHSMGGLIIRSALPRLQKYKNSLHSFITLSSPHLGYSYSTSKLVDAGLWFMNTVKKCTSLLQLTMNDQDKLQETFLYKLSEKPGLEWFKKVVFLGSHQDLYVPFYSARIQKHRESIEDSKDNIKKGQIYCAMVDNILNHVNGSIVRMDVNFCIPEQNLDNLIGRAAHISFINNIEMLRTFVLAGKKYFF